MFGQRRLSPKESQSLTERAEMVKLTGEFERVLQAARLLRQQIMSDVKADVTTSVRRLNAHIVLVVNDLRSHTKNLETLLFNNADLFSSLSADDFLDLRLFFEDLSAVSIHWSPEQKHQHWELLQRLTHEKPEQRYDYWMGEFAEKLRLIEAELLGRQNEQNLAVQSLLEKKENYDKAKK